MKKTYTVKFRRKRQGKTNYKQRIKLLASAKIRLIVRKTLNNMILQLVEFHPEGDKVVASAHSNELKKHGWKLSTSNIPAAYLTGVLLGTKAKKKGFNEAILDMGLNRSTKGSRIYAALKGVVDAGVEIPHSKEVLPDENRIKGKHIEEFIKKSESKREITEVSKHIDEISNKIKGTKNE